MKEERDARQDAMSLHGPVLVARADDAKADAVLAPRLGSILLVDCSGSLHSLRRRRRHRRGAHGRSDVFDAGRGWWRLRRSLLLLLQLHPRSWPIRSIGSWCRMRRRSSSRCVVVRGGRRLPVRRLMRRRRTRARRRRRRPDVLRRVLSVPRGISASHAQARVARHDRFVRV